MGLNMVCIHGTCHRIRTRVYVMPHIRDAMLQYACRKQVQHIRCTSYARAYDIIYTRIYTDLLHILTSTYHAYTRICAHIVSSIAGTTHATTLSTDTHEKKSDSMGVTLYVGTYCPFSLRCQIALAEKGTQHETRVISKTGKEAPAE